MFIFSDVNSPDGQPVSKDSNNLLFSLLLDQLSNTYQRQIKLSQQQCQFFFDQLAARQRSLDINPYPFEMEKFVSQTKQESESDQSHAQSQSSSKETGKNLGQGQRPNDPEGQGCETEVKAIPEWNCFMKSVNNSALMLVFLPASFDDLVLLNEKAQLEVGEKVENAVNGAENCETSQNQSDKDDSAVNSETEVSDKSSECLTAESDVETTTPTKQLSKDETQVSQNMDIADKTEKSENATTEDHIDTHTVNAEENLGENLDNHDAEVPEEVDSIADLKAKQSSKPLILPVYIYDCVIHNVLDSLINPWDFQLPADTYQDMTFDFQEDTVELGGRVKRVSFSMDNLKV